MSAGKKEQIRLSTIGWLMIVSEAMLLLFIAIWLSGQYKEEQRRLQQELQRLVAGTEKKLSDSLINNSIDKMLESGGDENGGSVSYYVNKRSSSIPGSDSVAAKAAAMLNGKMQRMKADTLGSFNRTITGSSFSSRQISPGAASPQDELKRVVRLTVSQLAGKNDFIKLQFRPEMDSIMLTRAVTDSLRKTYPSTYVVPVTDTTGQLLLKSPDAGIIMSAKGFMPYLLRFLAPQLFFSMMLLLLTGFVFRYAYRTIRQQKKFNVEKDNLISNISHELKTPVATVKVALEALTSYHALADTERAKRYLKVMDWETERLGNTIDRVMNTFQAESGMLRLHKEYMQPALMVEEVAGILRTAYPGTDVILDWSAEEELLSISVDKVHFTNAVFNIADNAIKYGGTVVTITISRDGPSMILKIKDNGIGLTKQDQAKIFDRFYRAENPYGHKIKGHGLGLSYALQIVKAHDGDIFVESRPGHGSVFTITILSL